MVTSPSLVQLTSTLVALDEHLNPDLSTTISIVAYLLRLARWAEEQGMPELAATAASAAEDVTLCTTHGTRRPASD